MLENNRLDVFCKEGAVIYSKKASDFSEAFLVALAGQFSNRFMDDLKYWKGKMIDSKFLDFPKNDELINLWFSL